MAFHPAPRLCSFPCDDRVASTICGISKPERITQTWRACHPIPQAAWDELMALPAETGDPEATRVYSPG
jgi:D-threo-aldose 1-dehydrogenase